MFHYCVVDYCAPIVCATSLWSQRAISATHKPLKVKVELQPTLIFVLSNKRVHPKAGTRVKSNTCVAVKSDYETSQVDAVKVTQP